LTDGGAVRTLATRMTLATRIWAWSWRHERGGSLRLD
jgi:hypothetical protein